VLVAAECDCHEARRRMAEMLRERFGLEHATLQVDHSAGEQLLEISPPGRWGARAPR
jgi:cobalt-zinc-cadmium efflux system protein